MTTADTADTAGTAGTAAGTAGTAGGAQDRRGGTSADTAGSGGTADAPAAPRFTLRRAAEGDLGSVLALYDEAIAWLAAHGRSGQWGATPRSEKPQEVESVRRRLAGGGAWLAEADGRVLGTLALRGAPPAFLPAELAPAGEPEVYLTGLVASRDPRARGVGTRLLEHARTLARRSGVRLLRLDCYAGGDGALVGYYRRAGFAPVAAFDADVFGGTYHGMLMSRRLDG